MKTTSPTTWKQRKTLYYAGIGLAAFGMLLVILAVAGAALRGAAGPRLVPLAVRALGGVGLAAIGFASMAVGGQGAPGSAIDMDLPFENERHQPRFEPEGRETDDPLAATATGDTVAQTSGPPQAGAGEMVCHWCHAVNDDQARYCDQCGMRF